MKKYPFTKQNDLKDCGPASLSMIIKYYGGYVGLEKLNQFIETDKNGSNAYKIIETARNLGFKSDGFKIPLQNLKTISVPFIAYTIINNSYSHFVVVYEINEKNVIIGDPANGIKKISIKEFGEIYKDVVLTFYPIHKIPILKDDKYLQKKIKTLLLKNYKLFVILIILSLFITFLSLLSSFYLKIMIDLIDKIPNLFKLFLFFLIIEIVKNIIDFVQNKLYLTIEQKIDYQLTIDIFSKIILLPYSYYKNKTTGDVVARFNDIAKIKNYISKILVILFVDSVLALSSMICLFSISIKLSSVAILLEIIMILIVSFHHKKLAKSLLNLKYQQSNINSFVTESIIGFESIKGLSLEYNFINQFNDLYHQYLFSDKKLNNLYQCQNYFIHLFSDIQKLIIIFVGFISIHYSILSIGDVLLFITILYYFSNSIQNIVDSFESKREIQLSIQRLNELIIDEKKENKKGRHNQIKIKNLTYYQNDILVLDNITVFINKNDKILLVGESGSGKSTLLKLLKGHYKSDSITYNKYINYENISYISQNEILFTNTIYNNIILNRKISSEDFKKVCFVCKIDEIVKKYKLGFNTLVEENGFNLSGGEKQRIILARTLISKSDFILIDEGLNQVDISMERTILKNIKKYYSNKIIILVNHRMDNADLFDKIWKLENKHIEEIIRSK